MAEASADGVEGFHFHDDLGRPRRSAPAGGDVVELSYREFFTTPWDLGKLEVKTTTGAGEERTAIVDALEWLRRAAARGARGAGGGRDRLSS